MATQPPKTFAYSYTGVSIGQLKDQIGYERPPAELWLPIDWKDDDEGSAYLELERYFQARGIDSIDAITIHIAELHGLTTLNEAEELMESYYGYLDRWAVRRTTLSELTNSTSAS